MKTISFSSILATIIAIVCAAILAFFLTCLTGCAGGAMRPVVHVDREGYALGITGTWKAVGNSIKYVVDPDGETLAK